MALHKTCIPNGFTLIEVIVVLGIFAILSTMGLLVSMDSYRSYSFRSEQTVVLSLLQKARNQSMANINQKPHGVYIDQVGVQYTLFQGADYSHRDTAQDIVFPGNASYVLGGVPEVDFTQLTGNPATAGNITIDDHIHPLVTISVNSEGQINAH